ncbi:integrase, catalytic region, zinc finger, CCHC-type containing protein [Tanacetum coccineum]
MNQDHLYSIYFLIRRNIPRKKLRKQWRKPWEREFRSSRKHFKTLSLDESRSPDFDLFSDQEEYSEEEVVETMAETMEQAFLMSLTGAELATVKYPKGIAKNVLVGIGKFVFPIDFIILDMPEDVKVPLILGRPFLSTAHAKIDVFKRKITLRVGDEKKLRRYQVDDLIPTIEEGEVIDEPMIDIIKTRNNENFDDAVTQGCLDTRISTSRGIQFLGDKLVGWMSKKQDCIVMSTAEAETKYQLADMFTKALSKERSEYLVGRLSMRCLNPVELEVLTNETA